MNDHVVIVAAKRTPIGHFGGYYKNTPAPLLGAAVLEAIVKNINMPLKDIDEVLMGCVLSAGLGQAPARQAALLAHLPNHIPCTTINKLCGSGLKAVSIACDTILSKHADIILAGGMENMSCAPYLLPGARFGYRFDKMVSQDHMMHDGLINAYPPYLLMGVIAEQCAKQFKITRRAQDQFALTSLMRAKTAAENNYFKNEIVAVNTILKDEGIINAQPEKITKLKPVFAKNGTITAANSSSISDGAAALCVMSASKAIALKIKPLAKIIDYVSIAAKPDLFPTAPVAAIKILLKKINWKLAEVDLFEINEAFAAVVLIAIRALKIPINKVNINGGACVLGHPIGASGARILVTLIHALKRTQKKRGIATLCIGGGEAIAMAIEIA